MSSMWNVKSVKDWAAVLSNKGGLRRITDAQRQYQLYDLSLIHFGSFLVLLQLLYPLDYPTAETNVVIPSQSTASVNWKNLAERKAFLQHLLQHTLGGRPDGIYSLTPSMIALNGGMSYCQVLHRNLSNLMLVLFQVKVGWRTTRALCRMHWPNLCLIIPGSGGNLTVCLYRSTIGNLHVIEDSSLMT